MGAMIVNGAAVKENRAFSHLTRIPAGNILTSQTFQNYTRRFPFQAHHSTRRLPHV